MASSSGSITLQSGLGLATFGSAVCLLAILPIAMNQFAIDGAGLTLALLSPLRDLELLAGKAIGNAIIAALPASICVAIALALFPAGNPALWLCLPLGLASVYLLVAPAAAGLSAAFPRAVDLNRHRTWEQRARRRRPSRNDCLRGLRSAAVDHRANRDTTARTSVACARLAARLVCDRRAGQRITVPARFGALREAAGESGNG